VAQRIGDRDLQAIGEVGVDAIAKATAPAVVTSAPSPSAVVAA
jgi:hypothetical protein